MENADEKTFSAEIERLLVLVLAAQADAPRRQVIAEALELGLETMLAVRRTETH